MELPPLNIELTMSQEFQLQVITQQLDEGKIQDSDAKDMILSLTRQVMSQRNVNISLIKYIGAA